jgi:hypothetical protein
MMLGEFPDDADQYVHQHSSGSGRVFVTRAGIFFSPEMTDFLANLAGIFANSIFCRNFRYTVEIVAVFSLGCRNFR